MSVVVVARHGERTDYVHRDQGLNWVQEQRRSLGQPWNPPLTPHGKQQATRLGLHLAKSWIGCRYRLSHKSMRLHCCAVYKPRRVQD